MPIKKSDLYSSLWASCDELRGGMDASQYKDYVLFMLFIKYITDKYGNSTDFAPPVTIPKGASFKDMLDLRGKSDIGDKINTQVIAPLVNANARLARSDFPDFNDSNKLGEGQAKVERLTNLINIFASPQLDFSQNRAEHDDILGDAYEYLMRHFATESGKSKGQFYTPAEVSRIIAKVIGISPQNTKASTTAYDPTCGSGSLLLKVAAEAGKHITLEGQEKDVTTAGLARMNMILHDFPTANIVSGNTLAAPKFKDGEQLRTYDYVVANPPFSDKTWSTGLTPSNDPFQRFAWGEPPAKQGDYAYLLHIIRSLKSAGKGACILPHGVLFRGNAEAVIRQQLVRSGYPQGHHRPAGQPLLRHRHPRLHRGARQGERRRPQGRVHDRRLQGLQQGRPQEPAARAGHPQDRRHLHPAGRRAALCAAWCRSTRSPTRRTTSTSTCRATSTAPSPRTCRTSTATCAAASPSATSTRSAPTGRCSPACAPCCSRPSQTGGRPGYARLKPALTEVKPAILGHAEFAAFQQQATQVFADWRKAATKQLTGFGKDGHPKALIETIAEDLLAAFRKAPLLDAYDIYQHLMDYWAETMQDDAYLIAADGWVAKPARIVETDKKGKSKDKGWTCDLIPKPLIVARYFAKEQAALEARQAELEAATAALAELEEEHGGEEGFLGALDKIAKAEVNARLKEIKGDKEAKDEVAVLKRWLELSEQETTLKRAVKDQEAALDKLAYEKYPKLTEAEIKTLVVDDKWMARLSAAVQGELDRVSQTLTGRIRELAERYATPLPKLTEEVETLAARVEEHLKKMGASWK